MARRNIPLVLNDNKNIKVKLNSSSNNFKPSLSKTSNDFNTSIYTGEEPEDIYYDEVVIYDGGGVEGYGYN